MLGKLHEISIRKVRLHFFHPNACIMMTAISVIRLPLALPPVVLISTIAYCFLIQYESKKLAAH